MPLEVRTYASGEWSGVHGWHTPPHIHAYVSVDLVGGGSGMEICTNYSRATKGQTMLTPKADQSGPKPGKA